MTTLRSQITDILKQHPSGLTVTQISDLLAADRHQVQGMLARMKSAYIDRWTAIKAAKNYVWGAVYALHEMPEDAPRPDRLPTVKDISHAHQTTD